MDHHDKKVLELVVFWLAVAHVVVSSIMTYVNCGKGKSQKNQENNQQKGSKKKKDVVDKTVKYFEGIINNNCFMWFISLLVCLAIAVLVGFCIWGDDDDDDSKK